MSAAQIMDVLPTLSSVERDKIAKRIWEMDHTDDDLALCVANAEAGFLMLDQMEAADETRKSR